MTDTVTIDPRALGYEERVFLRVVHDKAASNAFDAFLAAFPTATPLLAASAAVPSRLCPQP